MEERVRIYEGKVFRAVCVVRVSLSLSVLACSYLSAASYMSKLLVGSPLSLSSPNLLESNDESRDAKCAPPAASSAFSLPLRLLSSRRCIALT